MSEFFKKFPEVEYKFGDNESTVNFQNLSVYIDVIDQVKEYGTFYQTYHIANGERPDQVSYKLYGNPNYHWTFWLMNDHLREQHWPLDNTQLYLRAKQYYPHIVFRTTGVVYNNPDQEEKPLCLDSRFQVGNRVYLDISKKAGTIVRIEQNLGQIFVEFSKKTPLTTIADTGLGIADDTLFAIDEFSFNKIDGGDTTFDPLDLSSQDGLRAKYHSIGIERAYHQYDAPHHYENASKEYIYPSYATTSPHAFDWTTATAAQSVTYLERLIEENDKARAINVLKPDTLNQVVSNYNALLLGTQ